MKGQSMHGKRIAIVVGAGLVLAALIIGMLLSRRETPAPREAANPAATAGTKPLERAAVRWPAPTPDTVEPRFAGSVVRRPLIDTVKLDKVWACPGEDIQASMEQLRDVANPVQYTLPGYAYGNPAIVSFEEPGEHTLYVIANDGMGGLDFKSVQVNIRKPDASECSGKAMIVVAAQVSNLDEDTADIRIIAHKNLGSGLRYTYDFGDGTTMTSLDARTSHGYQLREQDAPTSTFVIEVRAQDEDGATAVGRASVAFRNTYWLSTVVGSPMIPAVYDRFPELDGDVYRTHVTFKNIEKRPIALSDVTVTIDRCRDQSSTTRHYPVEAILGGLRRLEAGRARGTELTLPHEGLEDACRVVVLVEGDTVPPRVGTPIGPGMTRTFDTTRAQMALDLKGPPLEGALPAAAPVAVTDDDMQKKLEMAEAILGSNRPITPEDLRRLELEGRLP